MYTKVHDWIATHAGTRPNAIAITDLFSEREYTYAQMNERVAKCAGFLRDGLNIQQGQHVAILSQNSSDFMEILFACARIGAVLVPLNYRLVADELDFITGDAEAKALFCDADFLEVGKEVAMGCDLPLIDMQGDGSKSRYEYGLAEAVPIYHMVDQDLSALWVIMYTSGTTGRPKGARITHYVMQSNNLNNMSNSNITQSSISLTFMPVFHIGGLNCYTVPTLFVGGRILMMRSFDAATTLAALNNKTVQVTHFLGVPATFQFMCQHPDFEHFDPSGIELATVGAAPMPVPLLKIWIEKGLQLQQGYGMTETGPSVFSLPREYALEKIGSCGKTLMFTKVRIVADDGNDVSANEIGELWVQGGNIIESYWNRPEANVKDFVNGWFRTGDAARIDEDGFYYIVDRTKDMYISGGENVYPAEVENTIYQLEGITEAAVIGLPDEKWGEIGCVVAVLKSGSTLTEEDILNHCDGKMAKFKLPRSVRFIDALPRNTTGKVLKTVLRQQAQQG
jgi:fatty-acyl-CoA synthase|tara:strand:- start:23734 stop:25260 length:1527 start_codon:yes stop_codon:yes gene_type:complete